MNAISEIWEYIAEPSKLYAVSLSIIENANEEVLNLHNSVTSDGYEGEMLFCSSIIHVFDSSGK